MAHDKGQKVEIEQRGAGYVVRVNGVEIPNVTGAQVFLDTLVHQQITEEGVKDVAYATQARVNLTVWGQPARVALERAGIVINLEPFLSFMVAVQEWAKDPHNPDGKLQREMERLASECRATMGAES